MDVIEVTCVSIAILMLLAISVMQDKELKKIKEDVQFYKDDTEKYENRMMRRLCFCEDRTRISAEQLDKTVQRTKELDDMYQNLNSRMNKHRMEHIMKGDK